MSVSPRVRRRVRQQARNRCGYCLASQYLLNCPLELDHLIPPGHGGSDDEENLWLACSLCNTFKSDQVEAGDRLTGQVVRLYNPRRDRWSDHFQWSSDGILIVGRTPIGRASVDALQLNNEYAVNVRAIWIRVGLHPPSESNA